MVQTQVYLFKDDPHRDWKSPGECRREKGFLHAVQGEAGSEQLVFHLMQNASQPFDLTGSAVTFYLTKPDGEKIFLPAEIPAETAAQGIASAVLTAQSTAAPGLTKNGELRVTSSDGGVLKFPAPDIYIMGSETEGALESTSEFQALDLALNKADEAFSSASAAAAAAQETLNADRAAVSSASQNAQAANEAAAAATSAANAANSAAQTASENAQSAGSAAQRANTAAASCEAIAGDINEAADTRIAAQKGAANGLASLDAQKKLVQMPTATDVGATPKVESGSWTPVLCGGTTAGSPSFVAQPQGKYFKFGNLVIVTLSFQLSGKGGMTGQVKIGGLPFQAAAHGCLDITSAYGFTSAMSNALIMAYTRDIMLQDASDILDETAVWAATGFYICQ